MLTGDVDLVEALGSELVVHFTIDAKRVQAEGAHAADAEAATISGEGVARIDPKTPVKAGDRVTFAVDADGLQFFDPESGAAIWRSAATKGTSMATSPWWHGAVLYQLYVRSWRDTNGDGYGDMPGIIERLDHLSWLGVDGLWLSPTMPSPDAGLGLRRQ